MRARERKMLAQHLYESALYGDHAQNWHKSRHVEDEVSLLSTSSAALDSHIGNTSNDKGALSFVGNRRINISNRRTSTRLVVGIVLALMVALAILLDVAERHVHVSNFRRHGRTIPPSAALQRRRRSEQKPMHLFRGQRRRITKQWL